MKRILLSMAFLILGMSFLHAQSYMNEWIDFNKTYYKFKVAANGLYRINQSQLASAGLGSVNAENFQLWRNGQQVPIYTSVSSGALSPDGYIEFWGEMNDGEWEKRLYLEPDYQINSVVSLFTDSSTYFLTYNNSGGNRRLTPITNDISSLLAPEPFFIHSIRLGYRSSYSPGYALVAGDYVYSASYDQAEGYTSSEVRPSQTVSANYSNLFTEPAGGDASLYYTSAGRALNTRSFTVTVNGTLLSDTEMNYFNYLKKTITVPVSLLSSNTANISFQGVSSEPTDRMAVGMFDLRYPRKFNFGGQNNFTFEIPASGGNNLVISNFNAGGGLPVLYDLTNGLRIVAQDLGGGRYRVVLPASEANRKLVLVSVDNPAIRSITGLTQRNFVNYSLSANQGNYLIVSNPQVYFDDNGINQVEQYRLYRSSANGGNFSAKIYDINELLDQFGWGIKNNSQALKNFYRFTRDKFAQKPKYTLIIGKGVASHTARSLENRSAINRLNLVPTFGVPASDVILTAEDGDVVPKIAVGRLNVINGTEVEDYLDKLKQYDSWQRNGSCNIKDEFWKKNVLHVGGANDYLGEQILYYLNGYKARIQDTLFGANVYTLQKSALTSIQTLSGETVRRLFSDGFSLLTYFGHSSASTLEFNLDNPENYPATGKFPVFFVNGCNAGNLFLGDSARFNGNFILSEKYVLAAPNKGAIAFIASTHLGIVNYLHLYTEEFYNQFTSDVYGESLGNMMKNTIDTLIRQYSIYDTYVRLHAEEITLHGDPAVTFYNRPKADFAIDAASIKVSPEFVSIAEDRFKLNIKISNLAKAVNDSLRVEVKREFPNGSRQTVYDRKIIAPKYADSILLDMPINALTDKGSNKIIVTLDPQNVNDETCETNNTVTKEFFIFEDEIRPAFPYNLSIVNRQNITYFASSANPLGSLRKYYFELDTTQQFNSNFKKADSVNTVGGSIGFKPAGVNFSNNTVYYWRAGMKPDAASPVIWNGSSFIYRNAADTGYNQSHYFQFLNNKYSDIYIDSISRAFDYRTVNRKMAIKTGLFPHFGFTTNYLFLDLQIVGNWRCYFNVFSIYVFRPKTLKVVTNKTIGGNGSSGSLPSNCLGYDRNYFEFFMENQDHRNRARAFLEDSIPDGSVVAILNQGTGEGAGFVGPNSAFIQQWQNDTLVYGSGKSIYHTFIKNGLTDINKFTKNLPFAFVYEKGNPQFVRQFIGEKENDYIDVVVDVPAKLFNGAVESPWMGPAKEWKNFSWDGVFPGGQASSDTAYFEIYGKTNAGTETKLATIRNAKDTSLSFINSTEYPYLKLKMYNADPVSLTPFQLQFWRLTGAPFPEGAIAPNLRYSMKDTVELGEPIDFSVAFRNTSDVVFDSLKLKMIITDRNGVPRNITLPKKRPLVSGDSVVISYRIDTKDLQGQNLLYFIVNPDVSAPDQPEQLLFNNFIYKDFYVKSDTYNPWMDVTFDGTHILNGDIVSSKPHIVIKLKDDSRFLALNDTSGVKVNVKFPGGTIKEYKLSSDSARFTPSNLNNGDNTATVDLYPKLMQDGYYDLYVSGTDRSGNKAGELEYTVNFQVINKPMISNMLNYPNPFTTSTAFVFTLTGSEVPQNIRIQILTVTGKVVREITKDELGPIRIGRNITEFKWDGTDQFGNKLANGIYLYRVLTNLNGNSLDRYKATGDRTDQFFNNGYGKMYLMR
ncbi:MAG: hypothetical protein K2X48_19590 [Chitinophagaceae bacterium]|nr:hypothetical protein [Chitinophagaceae bacterium]